MLPKCFHWPVIWYQREFKSFVKPSSFWFSTDRHLTACFTNWGTCYTESGWRCVHRFHLHTFWYLVLPEFSFFHFIFKCIIFPFLYVDIKPGPDSDVSDFSDVSMTAFCLIAMQYSRLTCADYVAVSVLHALFPTCLFLIFKIVVSRHQK